MLPFRIVRIMHEVVSAPALLFTHRADALKIAKHVRLKLDHLILVEIQRSHALEQKIGGSWAPAYQLVEFAGCYSRVVGHALNVLTFKVLEFSRRSPSHPFAASLPSRADRSSNAFF